MLLVATITKVALRANGPIVISPRLPEFLKSNGFAYPCADFLSHDWICHRQAHYAASLGMTAVLCKGTPLKTEFVLPHDDTLARVFSAVAAVPRICFTFS